MKCNVGRSGRRVNSGKWRDDGGWGALACDDDEGSGGARRCSSIVARDHPSDKRRSAVREGQSAAGARGG